MKKVLLSMALLAVAGSGFAHGLADSVKAKTDTVMAKPAKPEPFAFGDFTWLNGNDRRHKSLLDTKYFTGRFLMDFNYTASNHNPIDHTVVGSTALARDHEFEISTIAFGGDFHYDNVRASLLTQFGTRSTVVPRNDLSVTRGQFDLSTAYRYLSEANAGYHFNVLNGINVDAGLFMSYVGLFSYYNAENWAYQPSFTSDNTPWFFNGIRVQIFVSDKLKIEPWLINGWQSYGMFNSQPGIGGQILWRPTEWFQALTNTYYGADTQDKPGRKRFHSDNSIEVRYINNTKGGFISRAAFSVTGDIGFEKGDGVNGFHSDPVKGPAQYFASGMIYHRLWFANNHLGWTVGGGFINNPGRYLVLYPTGDANPIPAINTGAVGTHPFSANPGDKFHGYDYSTSFDFMPNDYLTFRLEVVHRHADVPYFAGHGGVTSPDGYNTTTVPSDFKPDLVNSETRFIGALLVRF
ncbi:outer membrane beta-barrel protein [Mucilaginibacter sp. KACC 22063]|uniref:outer membrane beta-barrel protein n=1 Tax=Mucilaginibacter sp. KACC 22063 TaxID=3025666 RepID=UPI002367372C|nr:outer membrane beta-barrel protein [Mucilaginibacter sp. KACC 22063]WDF57121.1 outer membrane beta-barrel protein [Mucilaginibacter sp. KACC 22063]